MTALQGRGLALDSVNPVLRGERGYRPVGIAGPRNLYRVSPQTPYAPYKMSIVLIGVPGDSPRCEGDGSLSMGLSILGVLSLSLSRMLARMLAQMKWGYCTHKESMSKAQTFWWIPAYITWMEPSIPPVRFIT